MSVETVIAFLEQMQDIAPKKDSNKLEMTFKQRYLLKLCEIPNTPEQYFTALGTSLVDLLYKEYPKAIKEFVPMKDRKCVSSS